MPKSKDQKKAEAVARNEARAKRSTADQLVILDRRGFAAKRERARLGARQ